MNETNKIQKLLKRNKNRIEIKWKEWEKLSEKQRIEKIFNDSRFFGDIVCEICLTHYKTETEYILIGDHGLTNEMIDLDNDYAICKNCWYKIKSESESSNKNRIIKDYLTSLVNKTYQDINNPKLQHAYQNILVVQNFLRAELDIYEKFEDSKKNNYDKDQVEDLEEFNSSKSSNSL